MNDEDDSTNAGSPSPSPAAPAGRRSVHDLVTTRILELLERGTVPWRAGWTRSAIGEPRSAISGKAYRGVNRLLLAIVAQGAAYTRASWLTFRQARELGGAVRRGEKGTPCIFWRVLEGRSANDAEDGDAGDDDADARSPRDRRRRGPRFVLRHFTVFNVQQCEGLPASFADERDATQARPLPPCDQVVARYTDGPSIQHGFNAAFYSPARDMVGMPAPSSFRAPEEYYSTLFHELTHSTGHPDRLSRLSLTDAPAPFGSADYSREELVAEMGAAFLCAETGISCATIDNQASYVAGWLRSLRDDSRAVIIAAAQAQRAVDHILGRQAEATVAP